MSTNYRFSVGPWNIHEGADPFGPDVREPFPHEKKFALIRQLGFDGVQLHDDDVITEGVESLTDAQLEKKCTDFRRMLENEGLAPEFVAPRLWFTPQTVDGGFTSNSAADRESALKRTLRCVDIARQIGAPAIVFWFAREGSYIRESKNARIAYERLLEGINRVLEYDKNIGIWIEPKPNEPTDQAYVPTTGHAVSLAYASEDHARVKVVIETAHALLANLDPSDEMAFALAHNKLGSVHLNDQNSLKYDQDKSFGAVNLRSAYMQIRVLEEAGYGKHGEFVGLDVKAMRTQRGCPVTEHIGNSRELFLHLVEKVRSRNVALEQELIANRDYEGLELYTLRHLLGIQ